MSKLRVLIVEDDPFRMKYFREKFSADDLTWAQDAAKGIKWLTKETYDLVLLDHDLAYEHYTNLESAADNGQGTGQEVAHYIVGMEVPPPFVFIHSWNPHGAHAIKVILDGAKIPTFKATFGSTELDKAIDSYRSQALIGGDDA